MFEYQAVTTSYWRGRLCQMVWTTVTIDGSIVSIFVCKKSIILVPKQPRECSTVRLSHELQEWEIQERRIQSCEICGTVNVAKTVFDILASERVLSNLFCLLALQVYTALAVQPMSWGLVFLLSKTASKAQRRAFLCDLWRLLVDWRVHTCLW